MGLIPEALPTRIAKEELLRTLAELEGEDLAGVLVVVEPGRAHPATVERWYRTTAAATTPNQSGGTAEAHQGLR